MLVFPNVRKILYVRCVFSSGHPFMEEWNVRLGEDLHIHDYSYIVYTLRTEALKGTIS